jgi:ectoine hydroxylase-related dioxygenase (phytanoyl-CoA dioxygenase family)
MTIMLMLDDATLANGCLHVVPGSHKSGEWSKRTDTDVFGQNEIDANAYSDAALVPLELKAGSFVAFGPFLVHQSAPNTSDSERRALLYSYQPAGFRHMRETFPKPRPKAESAPA